MALPKHLTPERMIRVALTAFNQNPALQECSAISIVGCVIQAAQLGLELTGPLGQAYMVPYNNKHTGQKEAQFQTGYRGLMDLAYRSGRVETFAARVVYANDAFAYRYGTKPRIEHTPTMSEPGEPVAVYAVLNLKGGAFDFEVMSKAQIDAHQKRYSKQNGQYSPWATAWEEMAKKTVIRRLAKRAPVSIEIQRAAVLDEYAEAGVPQGLAVEGISQDLIAPQPPTGQVSFMPRKNGTSGAQQQLQAPPTQMDQHDPEPEPAVVGDAFESQPLADTNDF
jgi:recombination protein RecT